ncbi:hypothetical protein JCM11641_000890 [Rhodosporidiobolus odoratus]
MPRATQTTEADEALSRKSLKAAVWYTMTKITQEEELSVPFAASEHFVASLSEVVFQQALSLGKDLERFAKHAGRMTINVDDVKLAARRNEPLYEQLCTSATQHGLALSDLKADQTKSKKAPRKTSTSSASTTKTKEKTAAKASTSKSSSSSSSKKGKEKETDSGKAAGGFVKASAIKKDEKGKAKRGRDLESDLEDDDLDGDDGLDGMDVEGDEAEESDAGSDSSEEVEKKRKKGKKDGGGKTSKKRRSED